MNGARRSTEDMVQAEAERALIIRDKVAYARQVAIDPDWRSVDGQALPDRFYVKAQRNVARGVWSQARATAYLQAAMQRQRSAQIDVEQRARRHSFTRLDAAMHNALKTGGASAVALLVLYLVTGPVNAALCVPLAIAVTLIRVIGGALTREVL